MACDRSGGFFPDTPVSSTNKTDRHDITEILYISRAKHYYPKPYMVRVLNLHHKHNVLFIFYNFVLKTKNKLLK